MNAAAKILSWMAMCCAAGAVMAEQAPPQQPSPQQTPPPAATAQSEAGDPRADTSNSATPAPTAAPAPSAAARTPAGRAAPVLAPGPKPAAKIDRLELGTATVTGDREQPKVMYIVPWKRSDIGDLAGKPMNSLVDEILSPVDRDVFKREVVYYRAVQTDASQNGASPKPTQQGEK
jgi:predicted lipid-binding transport protein (Tim44 family)